MLARPAVAVQGIWGRAWKRSDHWSCGMDKCWSLAGRSYWIPGSYAPALSEKGNAFLRLLNNKSFREESMTKVGLYAIGTSTTLESNKSHMTLSGQNGLTINGASGSAALCLITQEWTRRISRLTGSAEIGEPGDAPVTPT